jgi:hypothetical protein
MKIEILHRNGHYYWVLYDGPDGIDQYEGAASSLGCAMEQIISKRVENARFYRHDSEA